MGEQVAPYIVWNDPSVLAEGSGYRMWLSGGDARDLSRIRVSVYNAISPDGRAWTVGMTPVLEPGPGNAWDNLRIETPSVVRVGGVYHMYYSGFSEQGAAQGISQIGHAISADGLRWTKDPANPVVSGQNTNSRAWGFGGVGEPGALYDPIKGYLYLYYSGMRYSPANPTIGQAAVLLARSRDGSRFQAVKDSWGNQKAVLFQDLPGVIDHAWFGYTTPSATITPDGVFHLFASFMVAPGGPSTARCAMIDHAVSSNGVDFTLTEQGILAAGRGDWKNQNVRAPSVWGRNGSLMMWYAGDREAPFGASIALATRPLSY
ncbi:MAG: hypothetical protein IT161_14300 [Bryobacterales bacterium]|nr:hypothetical protein [Bryobacterales bacterium]